jgi:glycosyltransferase involved in cell wall biosynthesis
VTTTFSVAIPTHDRRELVTLAVRSALAQTRPPLEILVLADGCTDGTAEALHALGDERVSVIELPKGPGYGYEHRNVALHEARGDVVAWLGDDDLLLPDHLAAIGELWDAGEVELVQASAVLVDETGDLTAMCSDWSVERFRAEALRGHNRTPMAAVSHLAAPALAVGGWRSDRPRGGDIDLWARMLDAGAHTRMSMTPTVLHVRGSWREQTSQERIAQSGALWAALGDAPALGRLRADAARAWQRELAAREEELETLGTELTAERQRFERDRIRLGAELDGVYRETERQRALLASIYAGGWWRLRDRLLALPGAKRGSRGLARAVRALSRRAG